MGGADLLHIQPSRIVEVQFLECPGSSPLHFDPGGDVEAECPVAVMDGPPRLVGTKVALCSVTAHGKEDKIKLMTKEHGIIKLAGHNISIK